ncbi:MAG: hypothetical protein R3C11_04880 [Planctomycetaceae bacterium]
MDSDNNQTSKVGEKVAIEENTLRCWVEAYNCRDEEMDEFWEENGYALMPNGQGPFGVTIFNVENKPYSIMISQDPLNEERSIPAEPLEAYLIGRNLICICVITPDSIDHDDFSKQIYDELMSLCLELASQN